MLGVTGPKRVAELPDVPTFQENGIQMTGFENGSWYGIVAPAKTPDDVIAKLNAALNQVARFKEVKERLAATGVELSAGTPQKFAALLAAQYNYWGKTLRVPGEMPKEQINVAAGSRTNSSPFTSSEADIMTAVQAHHPCRE